MKKSELGQWISRNYPMLEDDTLKEATEQMYIFGSYNIVRLERVVREIIERKHNEKLSLLDMQ